MKNLDLFDSVNYDLRPQIREIRNNKLKAFLIEEGIYKMTLQEYAEWKVCRKPFKDLTESEIREVGSSIVKQNSYKAPYYDYLDHDAPIDEHVARIQDEINDTLELYAETGGRYGERGRLLWERRREQAIKLGLIKG